MISGLIAAEHGAKVVFDLEGCSRVCPGGLQAAETSSDILRPEHRYDLHWRSESYHIDLQRRLYKRRPIYRRESSGSSGGRV